jgi:hypothetical protein
MSPATSPHQSPADHDRATQQSSGVVDIVKSWLGQSADRSAHLEIDGDIIDVNKVTRSEQEKLIDQWLARHRRLED